MGLLINNIKNKMLSLDIFKRFEEEIKEAYVGPENVNQIFRNEAYYNMIPYPLDSKNIKNINQKMIYISGTEDSKNLGENSDDKDMTNNKIAPKKYIFGKHKNNSFYEVYSREIIFQLFEYPLMSYYKYTLSLDKSMSYYQIIKKLESIDQTYNINNKMIKIKGKAYINKNNKYKNRKNQAFENHSDETNQKINILEDKGKACNPPFKETNKEGNKIGMIKPENKIEDYSNEKGNKKKELINEAFENKTDKNNNILNNNNGLDVEEDNKISEKTYEKQVNNEEIQQKHKTKIKEGCVKGIKKQSISDGSYKRETNKNKQAKKNKQNRQNKQNKLEKSRTFEKPNHSKLQKEIIFRKRGYSQGIIKKIIPQEKIHGDFDLLIHSLNAEVLERVLNNKEISPCIFYGNFTIEANQKYDIIGEIKESSDAHEKLFEQVCKYIKLIKNLKNSVTLNKKIGFKKENKKIILYVFNGYYHRFIEDILDYKINQDKFKEMEYYKNKRSYIQITNTFDKIKESTPKNHLMNLIIMSGIPFIFIFIQNLTKFQEIKNSCLNEKLKELEKQINELKISKNDTNEYNNINNKYDNIQNISKDLQEKYDEVKIENNGLKNKYESLNHKYDVLKDKYDEVQGTNKFLKDKYDEVQRTNKFLKDKYDEVQRANKDLKDKYDEINEKYDFIKTKLSKFLK